jgi:hypothetical protein
VQVAGKAVANLNVEWQWRAVTIAGRITYPGQIPVATSLVEDWSHRLPFQLDASLAFGSRPLFVVPAEVRRTSETTPLKQQAHTESHR